MIKVGFGVTVSNKAKASGGIDGIGTYTNALKSEFLTLSKEIEIYPFTVGARNLDSEYQGNPEVGFGNFKAQVLISSLFGTSFWGAGKFRSSVDIVHATDHFIPNVGKTPLVATLMDAIPLTHPEWVTSEFRALKNYFWKRTAQWADKIITISEFSKSQISENFHIPLDRIVSIPLGVDEKWFLDVPNSEINHVKAKYNLNSGFFLSVGTLQPRKNVQRLIDAYLLLPEAIKREFPLVIVGRSGWGCDRLVSKLASEAYGTSIVWLRHLPGDDLKALVKGASAMVFPSLFEGFGLPVLEAFAARVPVIASSTTSLPEVAGDAALLIDPLELSSIAGAMQQVVEGGNLSSELVNKGLSRAKQYTWQSTALKTLEVYQDALSR